MFAAIALVSSLAACSSSAKDASTRPVASAQPTSVSASPIAATATPGDAFCDLEDVARNAGLAIKTSETDATVLKAQVTAALDASKAAAAIAPADYADIAAATIGEQEAVVVLLEKYHYNFVEALASDDGHKFFTDPALGEVKAQRDTYLQAHCNLAPTDDSSAGAGLTLSPGDEGIRQLFQLLGLGGQVDITDAQIDCAVAALSGQISDADLQAIGSGSKVSDAGTQAFVMAISSCGITIPSG